jgi:N-acetylglucosamine-6-phosphate deacetylase
MQATGLGAGTYWLGDLEVTVTARGPRLADGRLASSILTMDRAVSNLVNWTSASLADAITAATATPARRLQLGDRGTIRPGMRADLVVLDESGSVVSTFVAGQTVFARD